MASEHSMTKGCGSCRDDGFDGPWWRYPPLAQHTLTAEPSIGLLLSCNVVVRQNAAGAVIVEIIDTNAVFDPMDKPAIAELARGRHFRKYRREGGKLNKVTQGISLVLFLLWGASAINELAAQTRGESISIVSQLFFSAGLPAFIFFLMMVWPRKNQSEKSRNKSKRKKRG